MTATRLERQLGSLDSSGPARVSAALVPREEVARDWITPLDIWSKLTRAMADTSLGNIARDSYEGVVAVPQPPSWPPVWPPAPPLLFRHSRAVEPKSGSHHVLFTFLVAVLALGLIGVVAVVGGSNPSTGSSSSGTAGIGQAATDSELTFVDKSLTCGANAAAAFAETMPSGAKECVATITLCAKGRLPNLLLR
jgi:hypothetical protein